VTRIPIDTTSSTVDHFIPGLAVNKATSGGSAQVGVTYYFYTNSACGSSCQLNVGFTSSSNGGSSWSAATQLTGPFNVGWTATTSQGRMVGDYISTSYGSDNLAHGVFMNRIHADKRDDMQQHAGQLQRADGLSRDGACA
jgi:hypothetical protein